MLNANCCKALLSQGGGGGEHTLKLKEIVTLIFLHF